MLSKACWDTIYMERLKMACDISSRLGRSHLHPELAHVCQTRT